MEKFWRWLFGEAVEPLADTPVAQQPSGMAAHLTMSTKPLIVNPGEDEKFAHARDRLHQIRGHITAGHHVDDQRRDEFLHEIREHANYLRRHGQITEQEYQALESMVK